MKHKDQKKDKGNTTCWRVLLLMSFLLISEICSAQVNDAGLWTSINVKKEMSSNFNLSFSEELRLNENITEPGTILSEIDLDYKMGNGFSTGIAYRFTTKRQTDNSYSIRHRINLNLEYEIKINKISFSVRERFQTQYSDVNSSKKGKISEHYLRNKITFKYELDKKYRPYASTELWYQLSNLKGNEFDNVRYNAGFDYQLNKHNSFDFFYLLNREFNVNNPGRDYVFGISFTHAL